MRGNRVLPEDYQFGTLDAQTKSSSYPWTPTKREMFLQYRQYIAS